MHRTSFIYQLCSRANFLYLARKVYCADHHDMVWSVHRYAPAEWVIFIEWRVKTELYKFHIKNNLGLMLTRTSDLSKTYYLTQCWFIGALGTYISEIFNPNCKVFFQENAIENVICMAWHVAFLLQVSICQHTLYHMVTYRSGWTLAQVPVMAWCPMSPRYYLNSYWLAQYDQRCSLTFSWACWEQFHKKCSWT